MSTVQDLYNDLRYQIGDEPDVLSLINRAVWVVAKRLYWLGSEIITAEMSVSVFKTVTLTGSGIAFVTSDPNTITDLQEKFVATGFQANMPITTDCPFNLGPFRIDTVTAGTITLVYTNKYGNIKGAYLLANAGGTVLDNSGGSILLSQSSGDPYTITSDDAYGYLPTDFWGLVDRPYISGKDWPMIPLPSQAVDLAYVSDGEPMYYKIKGTRIYMTPHTSADVSVVADYFQKPIPLTLLADDLPWNNLFDDVIYEVTLRIFKKGTILDPGLINFVNDAVDLVAAKREKMAPYLSQGGIDYDNYI